ncbi:MAG: response regulator [Candidatus Riflebacteria bacterium]|nr:response regulator [Candidatus Riflebacteria bacterium]
MPAPTYSLLLVEDNPGDARLLQEELKSATSVSFSVTWVETTAQANRRLLQFEFDVILLDLILPDCRGLETLRRLRERVGATPIVVLTGLEDEEIGMRALQEGAHDYLIKGWAMGGGGRQWRSALTQGSTDYLVKGQLDPSGLARSLRFAIERHKRIAGSISTPVPADEPVVPQPPVAAPSGRRLVGFLGAMGGIGTTTVALNVAAALHRLGRSVALMELRATVGSLSALLRHRPARTLVDLLKLPVPDIDARTISDHLAGTYNDLKVLFSPQVGQPVQSISSPQFTAVMKGLGQVAEHAIIDLPFQGTRGIQVAIQACDCVCLVVEANPAGLAAGRRAVEILRSWGLSGALVGAIPVHRLPVAAEPTPVELASGLGCPILAVVPPADGVCLDAAEKGVPLVELHPDHGASLAFKEAAERLGTDAVLADPAR